MTRKKSKKGIILLALLLIVLALAGFWYVRASTREELPPPTKERQYTVEKGDITVGVEAQGKLSAASHGYFVAEGIKIDKVLVETGQSVKKGDTLAELSVSEANANKEKLQENYDNFQEQLDDLREDREDYLLSLNWLLENQKDESYNTYENKYWELQNEIDSLESSLDEANWKRDWSEDTELSDLSIKELEAELKTKRDALAKLEADREQEKALEGDAVYQKQQQEAKLREFDEKIAAVTAQLAAAKDQLDWGSSRFLTARQDGVILKRNLKNGEKAQAGQPFLELGDNSNMNLLLIVEPDSITDITVGQKVEFYVDAYPDESFSGEVTSINLVQNNDGKYEITAKVQTGDSPLLHGMNAGATVVVKQKKEVLTLQNKAISLRDGKQYVTVKNSEGEPVTKEITTGFSDGRVSEILSGLEAGDTVVYEG